MKILGIDPGTATTGYGIIEKQADSLTLIKYGIITTKANKELADRLLEIHQELTKIIKKYKPQIIACEQIFFFKNVKTAISVSHSRGVVLFAAASSRVPVLEVTPLQAKQAVACYGRATKTQVQKMVKILLNLDKMPKPNDAADALACAIYAANTK